jgi:hypothetical protein
MTISHAANVTNDTDYCVVAGEPGAGRPDVIRLWKEGLTQNGLPDAKFQWFYEKHAGGATEIFFLHHGDDPRPVGVAAIAHRTMRIARQDGSSDTLKGGTLVDFVAAIAHRTLFPAMRLQKEVLRQGLHSHDILFGLPNAKSLAVVHRAGYQKIGMMTRYVLVMRSANYLARHAPSWLASIAAPVVDHARSLWRAALRLGQPRYRAEWIHATDARFDDLWAQSASHNVMIGQRDAAFLDWRFVQCPFHKYAFFAIAHEHRSALCGYAVCEINPHLGAGAATLFVRDFLFVANQPSIATALWHLLAAAARAQGYAAISTEFMGNTEIARTLTDAGLRPRESRPLYAAARDGNASLLNAEHWYVTSADED